MIACYLCLCCSKVIPEADIRGPIPFEGYGNLNLDSWNHGEHTIIRDRVWYHEVDMPDGAGHHLVVRVETLVEVEFDIRRTGV